ncbi:MAG: hypothetical protein H0T47_02995 [Planctomycetaceae bacterium]|nr:hypothetical protein [Planctomycetaceae bacterium]
MIQQYFQPIYRISCGFEPGSERPGQLLRSPTGMSALLSATQLSLELVDRPTLLGGLTLEFKSLFASVDA